MRRSISVRWAYLAVGTLAMLFAGIIYAWSILKLPFMGDGGLTTTQLSLNFTITMSVFCAGGLVGARLAKALGHKLALVIAGILGGLGFGLTALVGGRSAVLLYVTYGGVASLGIGIAYNVILSTLGAWFPDKKGLCSGALMMGFGASALVLGNLASRLFETSIAWQGTYGLLGAGLGVCLILAGLILQKPGPEVEFPAPKAAAAAQVRDIPPMQMLRQPSFYLAFLYLVFLTAVGSSTISFARDLALDVGAAAPLATTLVGVLSVCNGLGRILTGACFDAMGCRKTMFAAAGLTIAAAGVTLLAVFWGNVALCVTGLCLTGLSYGASPTTAAAFTASFYGSKYYATNMAIMVFNMMFSSFVATLCGSLQSLSGGFIVPFAVLLGLSVLSLVLNCFIKKPLPTAKK